VKQSDVKAPINLLTHCNAGGLATVRYGTALAPVYVGAEAGQAFHVYADETRPLLQGSRITAFELQKNGIPVMVVGASQYPNLPFEVRVPRGKLKEAEELIAQAREKPGQFNHGVVGRGSLGDLSAEMFSAMSGARLVQIAYKGAPQVMTALIGGEIQTYFSAPVVAIPQMKAGRVRALGVSTKNRLAVIPDVPTIAEAGLPGYEVVGWNGILAPARTPRAIIDRLHDAIVKVIRTPDVAAAITAQGIEPIGNTPEEFARVIRTDIDKWAKLIKGARTRIN
jgi:tripartite-type tricarboxylate transporter receptor subunit TctC